MPCGAKKYNSTKKMKGGGKIKSSYKKGKK